ncbi:exodeoxyribonuclease VII small subunit [Synechococcus sp. LTW-G]
MTEAKSQTKRKKPASKAKAAASSETEQWQKEIEGLSYQEANTALELTLAKLQSAELEVEEMAGLYRRAEAYAARCQVVLEQVAQEVVEWEALST